MGDAVTSALYLEEIPETIGPARALLENYSKVPAEEVDSHIRTVRDKLWKTFPYPCIGRWRFLQLVPTEDPAFQKVLSRLKDESTAGTHLDVGCCVGQVLRQLANEGVDTSRLYGADLRPEFIDIGYELFRDKDSLKATFVTGDILNPADEGLRALDGKASTISAFAFFHLFGWDQQVIAAQRILTFLKPGSTDAIIFGSQMGSIRPGEKVVGSNKKPWPSYLHDQSSFQRLWDEVGAKTGTKWRVELELTFGIQGMLPKTGTDSPLRAARYTVFQI